MTEHLGHGDNQTGPGGHAELLAEFRLLVGFVLARVEPLLATFEEGLGSADRTSSSSEESSAFRGCSWCPVCALAAAINGEHHELLAVLAERVAVALALLREFLGGPEGGPDGAAPTRDGHASRHRRSPSAFVPINVTVRH